MYKDDEILTIYDSEILNHKYNQDNINIKKIIFKNPITITINNFNNYTNIDTIEFNYLKNYISEYNFNFSKKIKNIIYNINGNLVNIKIGNKEKLFKISNYNVEIEINKYEHRVITIDNDLNIKEYLKLVDLPIHDDTIKISNKYDLIYLSNVNCKILDLSELNTNEIHYILDKIKIYNLNTEKIIFPKIVPSNSYIRFKKTNNIQLVSNDFNFSIQGISRITSNKGIYFIGYNNKTLIIDKNKLYLCNKEISTKYSYKNNKKFLIDITDFVILKDNKNINKIEFNELLELVRNFESDELIDFFSIKTQKETQKNNNLFNNSDIKLVKTYRKFNNS